MGKLGYKKKKINFLAVFFVTAMSHPLSARQILQLLRPLGPDVVDTAADNLERLQREHPGLAVVSVRELFAGFESHLRDRARQLFAAAGRLDPEFQAAAGPKPAARIPSIHYGGALPPRFTPAALRWLFTQMAEVKKAAAAILRQGLAISPSHIVISACQDDFMTITATNTDKTSVNLYSQTPLVTRRGNRFVYFGDPQYPPSSETVSHWQLHQSLREAQAGPWSHVLHFHHAGLRDAALAGRALRAGRMAIPCIDPAAYGSAQQGKALARALLQARTQAATVAGHGTWFVGRSLPETMRLAKYAARAFH